jgi:hypothetical protein
MCAAPQIVCQLLMKSAHCYSELLRDTKDDRTMSNTQVCSDLLGEIVPDVSRITVPLLLRVLPSKKRLNALGSF